MIRRDFMKLAVAAVGVGTVGLTGCGGGKGSSGGPTGGGGSGGTLVMGLISAPTSFDPSVAEWGNRLPYYQAVYDTLLLATPTAKSIRTSPRSGSTTTPRRPSPSRSVTA
ncbi:hypothetical protein [Tessaracoccus aquimaris]|uniref:hypothetical protein n=1 Tax=Tessaracoccus aquimaris TaxID=1332264 RepID=UPI001D0471E1|nr:hypothetical protein [Tessaracoccus aquimaris]